MGAIAKPASYGIVLLGALLSAGCQASDGVNSASVNNTNLNSSANPAATVQTVSSNSGAASAPAENAETPTAPGLQQPDGNGDYYQPSRRSEGSRYWRVVDPDSAGLNCRMRQDWQGITFGDVDAPDDFLAQNYDADMGTWGVMTQLSPGALVTTDGGHLSQGIFAQDQAGKPWLAISIDAGTCFVRANSAFIQPTPPNMRSHPNRSGEAVYTEYRNEERSLVITSAAPWSGENGTGNFTFQRCESNDDGCDQVITGGKAACNEIACEIVWEGEVKHSISERRLDSEAIASYIRILNGHTVANNEDVTRYGKAFF